MGELRASDVRIVREQLGRDPTTPFTVVARCAEGHPLVIRNRPMDAEGRPFPTLYWLTCPQAVGRVSRVEAGGSIARLNEMGRTDPAFAEAIERAHRDYAEERGALLAEARGWGGVGGTRTGVKCLHAHYAHHLAGGLDEVGALVAREVEPIHEPAGPRLAAVDLGTNSIRLLVAEHGPEGLREVARDMVITRIGRGVDSTGTLDPDALDRTIAVLRRYCLRARHLGASRIRVAATSAVRDASNRGGLEDAVRGDAGSELEVISGEKEAELSFLGATRGLELPGPFLVLDIGGGSTEVVLGSARPEAAVSTQMGSVRLTERFVRHDPPTDEELDELRSAVDMALAETEQRVAARGARTLVAVAGTATTIQAIALELEAYDPEAIHRSRLSVSDAEAVLARLASMTAGARRALPVMAPGREDVIVAGGVILAAVMRRWGFLDCVVSEADILDGLALEMAQSR